MVAGQRKDKKKRNLNKGESQLPDGRYMYRYVDMYGNRKKIYSWLLEETDMLPAGKRACKALRTQIRELNEMGGKKIDVFSANNSTLNARWDIYREKLVVAVTTKSGYEYKWNKNVKNKIGQLKVGEITSSHITMFYNDLYTKEGLSSSYISNIHTLVRAVLDDCIKDKLITENPSKGAMEFIKAKEKKEKDERKARESKTVNLSQESQKKTVLTPEQANAFLDFLNNDKRCEKWKNLFTLLLLTGFRISEACGLTKNDISLKDGIVRIRRNLLYKQIDGKCRLLITPPKTDAGRRDFPIYCEELRKILEDVIKQYEDDGLNVEGISGWVFRNRYGEKPLVENNANDGLRRILSHYNESVTDKTLCIKEFTCHNFRHTFATTCERKGVSARGKKALLGHEPDKNDVTERYTHMDFADIQREAKKLTVKD